MAGFRRMCESIARASFRKPKNHVMAVATVVTISTAKRAHVVFIVFKIGLVIHFSILIVPVSPGCHAITQRLAHLSGVTAGITTAVHGLVVADVPARFIPSRRGRSPAFASQLGTLHAHESVGVCSIVSKQVAASALFVYSAAALNRW